MFGFDTAVISGTTAALQSVFGLSGFWLGFTVASALIGTIVGSVVVGRLHASSVWSVWNVWGQVLYCSILRANASISRPDPGS